MRNAIVDKNVRIAPGAQIGVDLDRDRERFAVSPGGIVVIGKGAIGGGLSLRVAVLTREFPPEVYGGAGVHVEYLTRELARLADVTVHCWGAERGELDGLPPAVAHQPWDALAGNAPHLAALQAVSIDLTMAAAVEDADVVHSHTWYANFAGHLARLLYGHPHVATVHSLEPLRPWKSEQLARRLRALELLRAHGSRGRGRDHRRVGRPAPRHRRPSTRASTPRRIEVIHNGIDADEYRPDRGTDVLERYGVDPDVPSVVFVGRITRQKGVPYLLEAALDIDPAAQLVLCAGAPDTPELAAEVARARRRAARDARQRRLDRPDAGASTR